MLELRWKSSTGNILQSILIQYHHVYNLFGSTTSSELNDMVVVTKATERRIEPFPEGIGARPLRLHAKLSPAAVVAQPSSEGVLPLVVGRGRKLMAKKDAWADGIVKHMLRASRDTLHADLRTKSFSECGLELKKTWPS